MKKPHIFCKECNTQTKYVIDLFSRYHLGPCHNMNMKEYYDKYFNTNNDGYCIDCGKEVGFLSYTRGYPKRCQRCSKKSEEVSLKISKSFEYRDIESEKLKRKNTCIDKYGVEHISQNDEIKNKIINTNLEKYGCCNTLQLDNVKNARDKVLFENKDLINEKRSLWWVNSENVINVNNTRRNTFLNKYGVEHVSQIDGIYDKVLETKRLRGIIRSEEEMNEYELYKSKVRGKMSKIRHQIFKEWNGKCYYTELDISKYMSEKWTHPLYPTIDHKISVIYGFKNNLPPEDIYKIDNLCICARRVNYIKNSFTEDEFEIKLEFVKEEICQLYQLLEIQNMK